VLPKKDGSPMAPSTVKSQRWNWVYETYGVKQAQEWLGHSDPATTLRHYVRLTTAARAKAVAGLDEVTRGGSPPGRAVGDTRMPRRGPPSRADGHAPRPRSDRRE